MYRSHAFDLLFGEYALTAMIVFFGGGFIFAYFIATTDYRKWWIYRVIMGKKAKPAGYRKWTESAEKRAQREAAERAKAGAKANGTSGDDEAQEVDGTGQEPK